MRNRYHIVIEEENSEEFVECMNHLGCSYEYVYRLNHNNKSIKRHYIAAMSKYELLYLRLTCSTGKIVDIEEFERQSLLTMVQNEAISDTGPGVH